MLSAARHLFLPRIFLVSFGLVQAPGSCAVLAHVPAEFAGDDPSGVGVVADDAKINGIRRVEDAYLRRFRSFLTLIGLALQEIRYGFCPVSGLWLVLFV